MNVTDAILKRRSIRKFKVGAAIPQEHLEQILTAAMMAPSACNTRPWNFVVVKDRDKLNEIMTVQPYTSMLKTASLAIVISAKPEVQSGISAGYFPQDCGAATENILLQALELGYGSCWCGVYPNEELMVKVQQILAVECTPFNIIALGIADEEPGARGNFEPERVTYIG